jgi:hypothetical protein
MNFKFEGKRGDEHDTKTTMNLPAMNDQLCYRNSVRVKIIVQVIVVAQRLKKDKVRNTQWRLSSFTKFTIIQLKTLITKLVPTIIKASLRDVERYDESKSMVKVGTASVSSDTATVNTETTKPTQREHKNELRMITFLAAGAWDMVCVLVTEVRDQGELHL